MACFNPSYGMVLRKSHGKFRNTGNYGMSEKTLWKCGKCVDCREARRREWTIRLKEEQKVSSSAYFITLTYDEKFLPITHDGEMSLDPSHIKNYWKKIRRKIDRELTTIANYDLSALEERYPKLKGIYQRAGKSLLELKQMPNKIKYYAVGEYGTQNHRPHYHAIVFNMPRQLKDEFVNKWNISTDKGKTGEQIGFVKVGTVTEASIHYVAGYMMNGRSGDGGKVDEFARMSQKLGDNYIYNGDQYSEIADKKRKTFSSTYDDKSRTYPMPRRYKEKIFTKREKEVVNHLAKYDAIERKNKKDNELIQKGYDPYEWREVQKRERIRQFKKNKKNRDL